MARVPVTSIELELGKLRARVTVFVVLLIAGLVLVLWGTFDSIVRSNERALESLREQRIVDAELILQREFARFETVIDVINTDYEVAQALQSRFASGVREQMLASAFTRLMQVQPLLSQVRWLDLDGMEQVRVDRRVQKVINIAKPLLQNKSDRYYVREALSQRSNELFVSKIDLNREFGQVVRPLQPVIRVIKKTDGVEAGLLIVNIDLTNMFAQIEQLSTTDAVLMCVDQDGYFLVHPDEQIRWGADLGNNELRLSELYPELWRLQNGEAVGDVGASYRHVTLLAWADAPAVSLQLLSVSSTDLPIEFDQTLVISLLLVLGLVIIVVYLAWKIYRSQVQLLELNERMEREQFILNKSTEQLREGLDRQVLLQEQLVESRKLASLGLTIAGVAHELNTPIGGALLTVSGQQLQLQNFKNAVTSGITEREFDRFLESLEDAMNLARASLERATATIDSFKRLAFERGSAEVNEVSLKRLIDDLAFVLKPNLKERQVELINAVDDEIRLHVNAGLLSQVLQNLIVNATKHAFHQRVENSQILVSADGLDNHIRISVHDNGSGISDALLERMFDPFVTSGRGQGHTGLGLHMVHQWVTVQMEGSLNCQTSSDGTCFTIVLSKG